MEALTTASSNTMGSGYFSCDRHKSKFRIMTTNYGDDPISILQATQSADFIIYLLSSQVEVDENGENILRCIKANGAVSHVTLIQYCSGNGSGMDLDDNMSSSAASTKQDSKERKYIASIVKSVSAYMEHHFPDQNVCGLTCDNGDMWKVLRHLSEQRPKPVSWRDDRSYLVVDETEIDSAAGVVKISGYARGASNFSANRIVHIPRLGDFHVVSIEAAADPFKKNSGGTLLMQEDAEEKEGEEALIPKSNSVSAGQVLQTRDDRFRENLANAENIPDTFASEQTFPTEEELAAGDRKTI